MQIRPNPIRVNAIHFIQRKHCKLGNTKSNEREKVRSKTKYGKVLPKNELFSSGYLHSKSTRSKFIKCDSAPERIT